MITCNIRKLSTTWSSLNTIAWEGGIVKSICKLAIIWSLNLGYFRAFSWLSFGEAISYQMVNRMVMMAQRLMSKFCKIGEPLKCHRLTSLGMKTLIPYLRIKYWVESRSSISFPSVIHHNIKPFFSQTLLSVHSLLHIRMKISLRRCRFNMLLKKLHWMIFLNIMINPDNRLDNWDWAISIEIKPLTFFSFFVHFIKHKLIFVLHLWHHHE